MDIGYHLKRRLSFLRQFYRNASTEFVERKRKIELEEYPFVPPYSEDPEPAFLDEWIEADDSLHTLGYACISMLAAALHLYLTTWESELGKPAKKDIYKASFKKEGWFFGYKKYFAEEFQIYWEKSSVKLLLIEEIVLVRNLVQHPNSLFDKTAYSNTNLGKLQHPFFVNDTEKNLSTVLEKGEQKWLFPPTISVSSENIMEAFNAVEEFCDWLEAQNLNFLENKR